LFGIRIQFCVISPQKNNISQFHIQIRLVYCGILPTLFALYEPLCTELNWTITAMVQSTPMVAMAMYHDLKQNQFID